MLARRRRPRGSSGSACGKDRCSGCFDAWAASCRRQVSEGLSGPACLPLPGEHLPCGHSARCRSRHFPTRAGSAMVARSCPTSSAPPFSRRLRMGHPRKVTRIPASSLCVQRETRRKRKPQFGRSASTSRTVRNEGGGRAAYTHHVSGSGMGSFFCAFTRLSTQRTITSTATPTISRKPISTSIRKVLTIPPIRPSQKVRMR